MTDAARWDIHLWPGATFRLPVTWPYDPPTAPLDVSTGYHAYLQVRREHTDAEPLCEATIVLAATDPNIDCTIDAADTAGLTPGRAIYDLLLVRDSDGYTDSILYGDVIIHPVATVIAP